MIIVRRYKYCPNAPGGKFLVNPAEQLASVLRHRRKEKSMPSEQPKKTRKKTSVNNQPIPESPTHTLGKAFEELGRILQDPDAKLGAIAKAAAECGLTIGVKFSKGLK